ncbi:Juvenile hormone esterase [Pseudolycoriella hygida]|uniref:carboxylesterase n=1 Tax=Pseudolycoriella hygida TaxID=35572 RepID=A0A9Q0N5I0_9DIPT|nr:Juvenile hormone esterase [Pseudolycoriella hygida]
MGKHFEFLICFISISIWSCVVLGLQTDDDPIVDTKLGKIQGSRLVSRLGEPFLAFRGIRYAEVPARFQASVPVKPWTGTFDATKDGPVCVQPTEDLNLISEDCLILNVYTRNTSSERKRAVLIYFHSGGFYLGAGHSEWIGPEHLMDRDIVLITVNYRLGILGFISTGTVEAPGNNGLKDQVQVLRWVKDNIDRFGGDPNLVTIMGYSAGGISVTLHMVSPMSQGLFHRVIAMSDSTVAQWNIPSEQLGLAKKQARLLNCSDESVESIMTCLKNAKKEDIAATQPQMFEFADWHPILLFLPIIEHDFGQERFLTQDPNCLMKNGQFAKVDILTGITEFEFLQPAIDILNSTELRDKMSNDFEEIAPICFFYERDTENSKRITAELRSHYFNDTDSADWLKFDGLKDLFADSTVGYSGYRFVQLAQPHTKLYHYEFKYSFRYSHTLYPDDKPYGAVHHDELLYLFRVPFMTPPFNKTDPENQIIEELTGWWTNFAQTGNPSEGEYATEIEWKPSTTSNPQYLEIDKESGMKNTFFTNRYDIWDSLFPLQCSPKTMGKLVFEFLICFISIIIWSCVLLGSQTDADPIVDTKLGKIQGSRLVSRLGEPFLAFRGIRYAEVPARFQASVPVKPWTGTFDATKDGPFCVQPTKDLNKISEDCLMLNVYTRTTSSERKRAVLIYFHSGGFYLGTGNSEWAGPDHLMDRDIVLVTVNYRLGILGFISTGTVEAPGNNGLKDQVQVLRWVKDNIDRFGGDPNLVTIMGYSAGGISVTLHMVSPMSQGLFHRVIAMSDSTVAQWDVPSEQLGWAKKQARLLNCSDESVESIMTCLKNAKKEDIAATQPQMFEFAAWHPLLLFKPVVERDFGQERFLTQDPNCLMKNGQFAKVDILTGITEFEFVQPAIDILKSKELRDKMSNDFNEIAPLCFLYERDTENSKRITAELRSHYFNDTDSADWLKFDGLKDLFADSTVGYSGYRFVQLAQPHTKLYHYEFKYSFRYSHTLYPDDKPYGAVHHDELLYLFRVPFMTPPFNKTDPENQIIEELTGWWANFAQTGNPSEGEYDTEIEWKPSTTSNPQYLEIDKESGMKNTFFTNRYDIWDSLFPLPCE